MTETQLLHLQRTAGNRAVLSAMALSAAHTRVQRFAGPEHVALGNTTTPGSVRESTGIRYTEDEKDELSFGEVVGMAGDYFGSIAEMRQLSATPTGREQLAYARAKVTNSSLPAVSPEAKKAVNNRYFNLASKNRSHFSAGGGGQSAYEKGHLEAVAAAWMSGHEHDQTYFTEALQDEAFCDHFLTDLFSSGHIRTPRTSIQNWYEPGTFPPERVKQWIKTYLVRRLNDVNRAKLANVPDAVIGWKVDSMLDDMAGAALDSFTVGDVVSLAMHDYDNERGVRVISQCKPDGTPEEHHWITFGDNQIGIGEPGKGAETFQMASAAATASRQELDAARDLGKAASGKHLEVFELYPAAVAATNVLAPFKALNYIPREDPSERPGDAADMSDGPLGDWRWGRFSPMMRAAFESAVRVDVATQIDGAAKEVDDPMEIKLPFIGSTVISINARQAVKDLADQLRKAPLTTFEELYGPASS